MNVLSLFDGVSCGRIALDKLGITPTNYFASEIDKNAIKCSKANWNDIIHIGDVTKVSYKDGVLYTEHGEYRVSIDLILAGSPCQGFSFAGKQLAFSDPRSSLYFEFERILCEIKQHNPSVKFLLENVKMKKESENVITDRLSVNPIMINSNMLSAQNRCRYYWCNFELTLPVDKGITLEQVTGIKGIKGAAKRNQLTKDGVVPKLNIQKGTKSNCVVASFANKLNGCVVDGVFRPLTPEECELLQTVPQGYTSSLSPNHRYKALGNGWTVDVISYILSHMFIEGTFKHQDCSV